MYGQSKLLDILSSKIKAIKVVRTIENWLIFYADFFYLIKPKHIVYVLRNGIRYKARAKTEDVKIIKEIWINRNYTPRGDEINKGDAVIDIGAHIGIFSIFASKVAESGKIYCFEPHPENFEMLKHNIEINKVNNIISTNKAVSNRKGQKEMFLSEKYTGGHSFYSCFNDGSRAINVETTTLKDIVEQNDIAQVDFLKMDCQGGEYEILLYCPDSVLKVIRKISMEYHNIDSNRNVFSLKSFLKKKGFKVETKAHDDKEGILYAENTTCIHATPESQMIFNLIYPCLAFCNLSIAFEYVVTKEGAETSLFKLIEELEKAVA